MSNDADKARVAEELAVQHIMANEDSRAFVWRSLEMSGIFADNFTPDPYVNARNEGARSQGLWLRDQLMTYAKGSYIKMLEENTDANRHSSN